MDVMRLALIYFYLRRSKALEGPIHRCPFSGPTKVFSLEGELSVLKCRPCSAWTPVILSNLQEHGYNIIWFKGTAKEGVELSPGETGRITFEGPSVRFWPAIVNDTGNYTCSVFNGTYHIIDLEIILEVRSMNEECYHEAFVNSVEEWIGSSFTLSCSDMEENKDKDMVWYKDCLTKVHTGASYTINKLQQENAGYYTCKYSLENAGILYNITRTWNLIVNGTDFNEPLKPELIYPLDEVRVEVELGEQRIIECKVKTNHRDSENLWLMLYWIFDNNFVNKCSEKEVVCEDSVREIIEENITFVIRPLIFNKIQWEHLNKNFNCIFESPGISANGQIILQLKGNSDAIVYSLIPILVIFMLVLYGCFKNKITACFNKCIGRAATTK
uniref:Interleukin 18 receptor 1 n=1 Tax=Callorhinchus milii TaxID=7868 RepID=V9KR28_CALMI|eukprot:gi/632939874/ref/XP_007883428.1/ PREDICTED: interleukin-1 receptor type 2-like [Callorhinchus milii]